MREGLGDLVRVCGEPDSNGRCIVMTLSTPGLLDLLIDVTRLLDEDVRALLDEV